MTSQPPSLQDPASLNNPQHVQVLFRPSKDKPWVAYGIMAITVLVYGLQNLSMYLTGGNDWLYALGGKFNELILAGQVWRLITPVLLHANFLHIAFNMYALYVLGPGLEKFYGHKRFLLLYLVGGYAGNVLSFLLSPNPSLGASTAIFGLVSAEAVFIYRNRMLFGARARGMLINLGVVVVVNLVLGVVESGIDNWGHLGGLLGGLIFAYLAGPRYEVQQEITGLELKDSRTNHEVFWGFLWSAGLFTAIVIGRFLVK
jgi:rhomboid protease GluP